MNFISIEALGAGVAATGEALELLDAPLRMVTTSQLLQVLADQLP